MMLTRKIKVRVTEGQKYGFQNDKEYNAIGTVQKHYQKEGKQVSEWQFLLSNDSGEARGVFVSKCKIVYID
jgi:hypothetical protein